MSSSDHAHDLESLDRGGRCFHRLETARGSDHLFECTRICFNDVVQVFGRAVRYVGAQLTFHYDRKQIILEQTKLSQGLAGKYVELYDFADRPLEVRWKGALLPYRVFSKDQRVSHAAIVENKRLGHALTIVKAQQDIKRETKVMTNSEKTGYKKRPSRVYGPDFESKTLASGAPPVTFSARRE